MPDLRQTSAHFDRECAGSCIAGPHCAVQTCESGFSSDISRAAMVFILVAASK